MSVYLLCPSCKARFHGPDTFVGRAFRCPSCQLRLTITADALVRARPQAPAQAPPQAAPSPGVQPTPGPTPAARQDRPPVAPASPPPVSPPTPATDRQEQSEILQGTGDLLDEDAGILGEIGGLQDEPAADKGEDSEPYEDFEVVEDGAEEAEEIEEVQEVEELEEVEEEMEDIEEVEAVDEDEEAGDDDPIRHSRLLKLQKIFFKGKSGGLLSVGNAYTLFNPVTHKRVGHANEVQEAAMTALRFVAGAPRGMVPTRIEVTEGRDNYLTFTVCRPARLWNARVEFRDPDGKLAGYFEQTVWAEITRKPFWIFDGAGRRRVQVVSEALRGRCVFKDRDGRPLGEMMTEAAYQGKIKIYFFKRGGSYYVLFNERLADRPHDKMLCLGTALGLDLLQWEAMSMRPR